MERRLTPSQHATLRALLRWLEIREQEGLPFPDSPEKLEEEIAHSALLLRLLEGKEELPAPPPLKGDFPWYELADTGVADTAEVHLLTTEWLAETSGGSKLVVNGYLWDILEETGPSRYVVTYREGAPRYRLEAAEEPGLWRIERLDPDPEPE